MNKKTLPGTSSDNHALQNSRSDSVQGNTGRRRQDHDGRHNDMGIINLLHLIWDRIRNDMQYRADYLRSQRNCTDADLDMMHKRWEMPALLDPESDFEHTEDFLHALGSFIPDYPFIIVNQGTQMFIVRLDNNMAVPLSLLNKRKGGKTF